MAPLICGGSLRSIGRNFRPVNGSAWKHPRYLQPSACSDALPAIDAQQDDRDPTTYRDTGSRSDRVQRSRLVLVALFQHRPAEESGSRSGPDRASTTHLKMTREHTEQMHLLARAYERDTVLCALRGHGPRAVAPRTARSGTLPWDHNPGEVVLDNHVARAIAKTAKKEAVKQRKAIKREVSPVIRLRLGYRGHYPAPIADRAPMRFWCDLAGGDKGRGAGCARSLAWMPASTGMTNGDACNVESTTKLRGFAMTKASSTHAAV